jgi:hypothetical protein
LRLLIVVAACSALIASLGDLPQIMLAHLYPHLRSPGAGARAVLAFAQPTSPWSPLRRDEVLTKPFDVATAVTPLPGRRAASMSAMKRLRVRAR